MRPAHYSRLLFILFATISFGCREDVVEELESYGVKREWIPFAGALATEENYGSNSIPGANPWYVSQVFASPYTVDLAAKARSGKKALKVTAKSAEDPIYISRYEPTTDLVGNRIRFSGHVRPESWNGKVEAGYRSDATENELEINSKIETLTEGKWSKFEVEIDLGPDATYLSLVLKLDGAGTIYVDDCSIQVIGPSTLGSAPRSVPALHANLGFEDGDPTTTDYWGIKDSLMLRMPFWRAYYPTDEYKVILDSVEPHSGKYAGGFRSTTDKHRAAAFMMYEFPVELMLAHRVRFNTWIKPTDLNALVMYHVTWRGHEKYGSEIKRLWEINGTGEWKQYSIEIDVPLEAKEVRLDVLYHGTGTLLVDDLTYEKIKRLPNTDSYVDKSMYFTKPPNMDFESP